MSTRKDLQRVGNADAQWDDIRMPMRPEPFAMRADRRRPAMSYCDLPIDDARGMPTALRQLVPANQ